MLVLECIFTAKPQTPLVARCARETIKMLQRPPRRVASDAIYRHQFDSNTGLMSYSANKECIIVLVGRTCRQTGRLPPAWASRRAETRPDW